MDVIVSTKAKEATAIVGRLFKTSGHAYETQPLLHRLQEMYPGVVFTWDHGLRVKVPRGVVLPKAISYFARQIDEILEDGSLVKKKNVEPESVIGPSRWQLIRHPLL